MSKRMWNSPKRQLRYLMGEISEEYWCAGWLLDIEFYLWSYINFDNKYPHDLRDLIADRYGRRLLDLWDEAGGWWYWDETTYKCWDSWFTPDLIDMPIGERFAKKESWLQIYKTKIPT